MKFKVENNTILVYKDTDIISTIIPIDRSGLCLIYVENNDPTDFDNVFLYRAAWKAFRSMIDGCSDICKCTAMDAPVPIEKEPDYHKLIARAFITTLENITDSAIYATGVDDPEIATVQIRNLRDTTDQRANIFYFDRFVDLYEVKLSKDIKNYRSQIRCRKDKSDLVRHYYSESHVIGNENLSSQLMKASNETLNCLRDYTESSNRLIEETNKLSQDSEKLAEESLKNSKDSTKYARWAFIMSVATLIVTTLVNIYL